MFLVTDRKATACGHGGSSGQHAQMAPRKKAGASKKQGQSKQQKQGQSQQKQGQSKQKQGQSKQQCQSQSNLAHYSVRCSKKY